MTRSPLALAIALAFSLPLGLSGCDRTAQLSEQEYIQRAKDFEDQGNLRGSIVELKNAIQKNPDSPQARLLLAQLYLKSGFAAEAEKEFSRAEKLGVGHESIQIQLGEALLLMGEFQRVLDEIQPGERTSKANLGRIYQLRADALFKQRKPAEACKLYQQALDTDAQNPPTYWGLAQCAVMNRDLPQARRWLDTALGLPTGTAKTWVFLGSLEQLNNNSRGALAAYGNALKAEPNNLEALLSHATLSITLGQWDAARKNIDRTRKLSPDSIAVNYLQALYAFGQKQYPQAREALQNVFKTSDQHMPSVLLFAETHYALGAYEQAESLFNRFLAQYPGDVQARRLLAATQIRLAHPAGAIETLAPLLGEDTKDTVALLLASEAHRLLNAPEAAAAMLEKAARIDPRSALVQTRLGLSHLLAGDAQRAIPELQTASTLSPTQSEADKLLVLSYLERKDYDRALRAIDVMQRKLPRSPLPHALRGEAYKGKGDWKAARTSFEHAVAMNPSYFPAVATLAQFDVRDNRPEQARARLEKYLAAHPDHLPAMMALAELAGRYRHEKLYVAWLDKAIKAHPAAVAPRSALVNHYMAKKAPGKALAIANAAVSASPENTAALDLLGTLQLAQGDKAGALSTFTRLVKKAPRSPDAYVRLAVTQMTVGRPGPARLNIQKALQLKPDHVPALDALLRLDMAERKAPEALQLARRIQAINATLSLGYDREGDILAAQGQPSSAAAAYQQAVNRGAGAEGLIKLHNALLKSGDMQAAAHRLNDWLKRNPADTGVLRYAAEDAMRSGRNKEAITLFEKGLRTSPDDPSVLNNLASLYQLEKDPRALSIAQRAARFAPENPSIQDTLGWILLEHGQTRQAYELLGKAVRKAPKSPSIRYHHAVALARIGNKTRARQEVTRLLQDTPQFSESESARTFLKQL